MVVATSKLLQHGNGSDLTPEAIRLQAAEIRRNWTEDDRFTRVCRALKYQQRLLETTLVGAKQHA